jgi:hypothetical protein
MCILFEGLLWKTKSLYFCGPCTFRYHLSCVSDTEYQYYTGSGISAFNNKCASCVKNPCLQRGHDTPAQTRSSSISDLPNRDISPERYPFLFPITYSEKYKVFCVHHETVCLSDVCAINLIWSLIDTVNKKNDDVTQVKSDNTALNIQIQDLFGSVTVHISRVDPCKKCESCGNARFRERK